MSWAPLKSLPAEEMLCHLCVELQGGISTHQHISTYNTTQQAGGLDVMQEKLSLKKQCEHEHQGTARQ